LTEPLHERLDRLIASGACPPIIVAAPDCFTRVGGNQYINSAGTGPVRDYLVDEIIPFVDENYRTLPQGQWGVFGKSSGGYGAIVARHAPARGVLRDRDHSGDSNFELCYLPDLGATLDAFREAGGPAGVARSLLGRSNRRAKSTNKPLTVVGMAAHYSPTRGPPGGTPPDRLALRARHRPVPARGLERALAAWNRPHGRTATPSSCAGCADLRRLRHARRVSGCTGAPRALVRKLTHTELPRATRSFEDAT